MLTRNVARVALALLLTACSSESSDTVTLTLDPAGSIEVTGPVRFVATADNTREDVGWTLEGPGSLSATSGREVVYRLPSPPSVGATATLTASVPGASASATLTLARPILDEGTIPSLTAPVEVLYDEKEIPHVRCAALNDCLAVQGYLHARDRLFQMDFLRRVSRGRVAELVGVAGLSQDVQLRTLFTTRDGRRLEDALADAMETGTRAKVDAYVAGVNAYLAALKADPSAELPGEYAQLPHPITAADIPDWTVADVTALARLQQFGLSESIGEETDYGVFAATFGPGGPHEDLGKLSTWIRAAQPVGAQAHTVTATRTLAKPRRLISPPTPRRTPKRAPKKAPAPPLLAGWGRTMGGLDGRLAALDSVLTPLDGAFGSNNWVVAATHSATGQALVANDPHLSLQYPPNFHLSTLTSSNPADNLDLTGGAFPGIPGAQVGRGKNVGWGVTVVGYDVTDLYLEQAVPCPAGTPEVIPFCVSFMGEAVRVLPVLATWRVRTASGLVDARTALPEAQRPPAGIIVVPQHGPLIQAPDEAGRAVTVRWTGHESWTQDFNAFLGLNTATDVDAAMVAIDDYATGAQNFVLADDQGHIAYYPHALVPVRNFADPRVVGTDLMPPWLPLPGDGSAEWGSGNPADNCAGVNLAAFPPTPVTPAAACWVAKTDLPQGKDPAKGFFATANSDPLGVSDSNNPLASPPYLSFDWSDPTGLRITQIVNRLTEMTADGRKVTLEDMQDLQADHSSLLGKMFATILAATAFDAAESNADFAAARAMIGSWAQAGAACPTGLVDIDPASAADPDEAVTAASAGCYLFHAFLRSLVDGVFADDLALAGLPVAGGPAVRGILHMLQPTTPAEEQTFCDDVGASGVTERSCGEQVVTALVTAYRSLGASRGAPSNWRWGRVHTMQPTSQFPLVTRGYSPGPYARPGGAFTVDVANPSLDADSPSYTFSSSANVRHISVMDAADPVVKMQLPGPERSIPAGVFTGPDLLVEWVRNEYFDFAHGARIDGVAVSSQDFAP